MTSDDNITSPVEDTSYKEQAEPSAHQVTNTDTEQANSQVISELFPQPVITESDEALSVPVESSPIVNSGFIDILPLLWFIGVLILACYISLRNIILWRAIKRERQVTDQQILDLLEDCKMQMQVQTVVGVVVTDKVKSPALFGFVRPRLLLPQGILEELDLNELQYVFLHELAHLRRRDIYLGWVVSLLQVLHWFNPLIWFAFRRMRTDQELACDALALSNMSAEEPQRYGKTLVSLFEKFSQINYVPSIAGILEDKSQLERRIKMITLFKKNSYQWSPLAVILIAVLACVSLPDAKSIKASVAQLEPATMLRKLTYPWGGYSSISPDGRYVCDVDWDIDWETETEKLIVRELETGEVRVLPTTGHPEYSAISPTGTQVAYLCHDTNWANPSLYVIGLDGANRRCIREGDSLIPKDWSADGRKILALEYDKNPKQLVWISVADGLLEPIVSVDRYYIQGEGHPGKFDVSPDGRFITYDRLQSESTTNHDLAIFDLKENRETAIASHPADEKLLGWTPDGRSIFFASDRSGAWDGWLQRVTNSVPQGFPELVRKNMGDIIPIDLIQGGAFYYHTGNKVRDVFVATLDFEKGQVLASPMPVCQTGTGNFPAWSPNGQELAYCTGHPGEQWTLHIRNLANGQEREIDTGLLAFAFPRWSADGRFIVGSAYAQQPYGIYKIDVETGERTELVSNATEPSWRGALFSDGQTLLCSRGDPNSGGLRYLVRNLTTGREKSLIQTTDPLRLGSFALSPDEQWLAYTTSIRGTQVQSSLKVIPVKGGEPRTLVQFDESDRIGLGLKAWMPDNQRVLFVKRLMDDKGHVGDKGHELWQIPVQGGEPRKVWTLETPLVSLSVHPDGQRIAFHTSTTASEVWVMENFLPETTIVKPEPDLTPTLRQIEVKGRGSVHSFPSFDDKYMSVVVRDRETGTDNLVIRELATGKERMLVKNTDPNWFVHGSFISRDSKKVVFYHYNPNKDDFDLRMIGIDGSNLRTLLGAEIAGYFNIHTWSPDGKYIFGMLMKKPMQLARISLDDGSMDVLKTFEQGSAARIDASPDGRYLAYSRIEQEGSNPDIFIYDLQQSRETPLVRHSASDKLLAWTPDGLHIFFVSDRNGTWDGWLQRLVDGKPVGLPEIIKAGIGDVGPIGFTQSGAFYYAFDHEAWNVYTAELDRNTGEVVSEPVPVRLVGKDICPDFSPDGQYLAYLSEPDRSKPQVIRIRTLATGRERELRPDLPRFERLRWCPDSRHLLITFFRSMDSPSTIYTVDIQTGKYTALTQIEDRNIRQAELLADGKTLIYRKLGLGTVTPLIIRDIETGSEKELQFAGTSFAFWSLSPDGKEVAYSIREVGSTFALKIASIETGESRTLVEDAGFFPVWSNDGRDVFFTRNVNELWRVSAEGGEPEKLFEWKEMIMIPCIHPNGQHIAFHSGGYVSEMWVMENFLPEKIED